MKRIIPLATILLLASCMSPALWHASKGKAAFEKQKYKRATRHLEKADRAGYSEPGFHFILGSCYLCLGRYEEAVKELSAAASESAVVWFTLGNAYYNRDDNDNAAASYRKAIALNPDYLEAIEALAMLYPAGGVSREEAISLWKRALEMEKRDEWITRAKHYIEQLENEE
jgi:Flp pilus assembly protein TadD